MHEDDNYVLVLGSKPEFKIPNLKFKHIYAANGAIERVKKYETVFSKFELISVLGGREFEKNEEVKKRVLLSNPNRIICRLGNIDVEKYNLFKNINYKYFTNYEQLKIQSKFFKYGLIKILYLETFYENNVLKKIFHMYNSVSRGTIVGTSTGFFAILCALMDYPEKKIIISGIGMKGGSHMYNNPNRYNKRSIVDRKLILNLKKNYKSRLYTTDSELSKNGKISYYDK